MTDADQIEELAQTIETKGICVVLNSDETVNKQFWIDQATFLRSLSTTLADLQEKAEALEFMLKHLVKDQRFVLEVSSDTPPYLRKRLMKE